MPRVTRRSGGFRAAVRAGPVDSDATKNREKLPRLFEMLDNPSLGSTISWCPDGEHFMVIVESETWSW